MRRMIVSCLLATILVGCGLTAHDPNSSSMLFVPSSGIASAQYPDWQHSGLIYILTTPEGADLPATAREKDFPLLVRLNKDWFDFNKAKPDGEDIRFSTDGKALSYQIEQWDSAGGTASIWVSIPEIRGNARQAIRMHWGNGKASNESDGEKVFRADAGFAGVWHLGDDLEDSTSNNLDGTNNVDKGTINTAGIIGDGQVFGREKGLTIRQPGSKDDRKVTCMPSGNQDRSMSAWINPTSFEGFNWAAATIGGWGGPCGVSGGPESRFLSYMCLIGKAQLRFHIYGLDPRGATSIPQNQWRHVALSVSGDMVRFYVDGVLDQSIDNSGKKVTSLGTLKTTSATEVDVGNHERGMGPFNGALDEVRFESAARSANWMKLCYENQKPMQTVVGPLVQSGAEFSVSAKQITLKEGESLHVTAKAGGAQKISWIIKKDGMETIEAMNRFAFTVQAGRVTKDETRVLQFKAVFADGVKTIDIPVTIKKSILDPVFTLKVPSQWDGRKTIEVVLQIFNLKDLQKQNASGLTYDWTVSGMPVIKEVAPGKLILKRALNSGKLTVTAKVSNGGAPIAQTIQIVVKEPEKDAWVQRTPAEEEKPQDGQFYARGEKNEGALYYNGTFSNATDEVYLKVYADDKLIKTERQSLKADKSYAFSVKLKAGLIKYKVEFGTKTGGAETAIDTVSNIVCGDVYLIDGQSNALATDTGEKSPLDSNEWIRSYGYPRDHDSSDTLWGSPVWKFDGDVNKDPLKVRKQHKAELGWWGMELAKRLLKSHKMPICIINGAVGGTRIDEHQRSQVNPTDLKTIYGRMLWRVQQARLTHGVRAVIWHQGEAEQSAGGPAGREGCETYHQLFSDMSVAWKQDFPNLQHYYVFQIWPNACAAGGQNGAGDRLRESQRTLSRLYSNMDIMSTLGIKPPGPAHFPLTGWAEFARLIQPLIERDIYGKVPTDSITAPNLKQAYYATSAKDAIALEFDQPVVWNDSLINELYLDDAREKVASGSVSGNMVTLKLKESSDAKKITYLKEVKWSQDRLIMGANGIAALTFCDVPILPSKPTP